MSTNDSQFKRTEISNLAVSDVDSLGRSHAHYKDSWKKRGGVGAFMMLARKWDRLENAVQPHGFDIFKTILADMRAEGVMDDLRDLRRYLFLVDSEFYGQIGEVEKESTPSTATVFRTDPKDPLTAADIEIDSKEGKVVILLGSEISLGIDEAEFFVVAMQEAIIRAREQAANAAAIASVMTSAGTAPPELVKKTPKHLATDFGHTCLVCHKVVDADGCCDC